MSGLPGSPGPGDDPGSCATPTQRRILHFLAERPGASLQEVADHVGVARTAAVYHLRRLADRGLVATVRQGNRVLHFPPGAMRPVERSLVGVLRLQSARQVIRHLQLDPGISWRKLAKALGLAPHTIRWHVSRLEEHGLIRVVEARGRKHVVSFHPELQAPLPPPEPQAPRPEDLPERLPRAG